MTIYLDNAATSFPKPEPVCAAVDHAMRHAAANPGRGGYRLSLDAGRMVLAARMAAARLVGLADPARVIFTANATEEINLGLFGVLQPGDRVVTTSMEHNAVVRPLRELAARGVEVVKVVADANGFVPPGELQRACTPGTRLLVMTHCSNVTGTVLIIVAARPSMGKTSFCLNVAANAALEHKVPVAIFSLEMSRDQLVERLLASEAFVDLHRLRSGGLRPEDYPKLSRAAGLLGTAPIWIDDTPALTLLELRSKARRLKAEHDTQLFVVDYLQLIRGGGRQESRQEEISYISRSLKALARELQTPVVALSQLSRAPEQRGGDRRPMLSDLRDSGAIEQDADLVIFIYRPEMYATLLEKEDTEEGVAEVMLAKHRNGPTGTVKLAFLKQYTRFDNLSARTPEGGNAG